MRTVHNQKSDDRSLFSSRLCNRIFFLTFFSYFFLTVESVYILVRKMSKRTILICNLKSKAFEIIFYVIYAYIVDKIIDRGNYFVIVYLALRFWYYSLSEFFVASLIGILNSDTTLGGYRNDFLQIILAAVTYFDRELRNVMKCCEKISETIKDELCRCINHRSIYCLQRESIGNYIM